jgi:hypothetical protein
MMALVSMIRMAVLPPVPKTWQFKPFAALPPTSSDANDGYRLGLRVYRANAFEDSGSLKNNDSVNKVTQTTFTGGLGDRKAPLIEMTTEIFVTNQTTYQNFCDRLGCG